MDMVLEIAVLPQVGTSRAAEPCGTSGYRFRTEHLSVQVTTQASEQMLALGQARPKPPAFCHQAVLPFT